MVNTYDKSNRLSFEEIMEILEEELASIRAEEEDDDYKPLNFHDETDGYEGED